MNASELKRDLSVKDVLVPTDFSPCSYQALLYALAIARYYTARVTLLHVVQAHREGDPQEAWRDIRKIETDLAQEGHLQGISLRLLVEQGEIWDVVSRVLTESKTDLIVMGTHGRTGFEKLVLGSFAETVFRGANCPVLTVGPRSRSAKPDSLFRIILFATDFSSGADAAEPYAFSLSRHPGTKLTLLNVVQKSPLDHSAGKSTADKERLSYARARLEGTVLYAAGLDSGSRPDLVAEIGSPVDTILKEADRISADLIVLGLGAPRKLADRLGWSNAYRVVCGSHCPVLTVREPFPGPYFERIFAMNATKPSAESNADNTATKSGATEGPADSLV